MKFGKNVAACAFCAAAALMTGCEFRSSSIDSIRVGNRSGETYYTHEVNQNASSPKEHWGQITMRLKQGDTLVYQETHEVGANLDQIRDDFLKVMQQFGKDGTLPEIGAVPSAKPVTKIPVSKAP